MTTQIAENYILNPLIEIKGYQDLKGYLNEQKDELTTDTIKKIKKGKLFLLTSSKRNLLINDTIKAFLTLFKLATTEKAACHSFAISLNTTSKKVRPTFKSFLHDMLYQGVLIPSHQFKKLLKYKKKVTKRKRKLIFQIGSVIQQYKILEIISEKPKFDIIKAEHQKDHRKVVIKALYLSTKQNSKKIEERKKILKQEFQLLKEVNGHPNICQYYGYYKNNGQPFGVMEYIKGLDLGKYIKKNTLTLQQKTCLIQQVFNAIAHIHTCGIVHGDIHNSNFLITKKRLVKLIDFDIANHHQLKKKEIERWGGVYKYFPPEKISKNSFDYIKGKADYRSEVYQVAIIAYYILYERHPFKALTWGKLAKKIQKEIPIFDPYLPNNQIIPPSLISLLHQALSKNPEDRFASVIVLAKKWKKERS